MPVKKIIHDLDLDGNELKNITIDKLAADPPLTVGRMWYNTTDNKLKYYDGTSVTILNDLSAADIKSLYESNADTNEYTDAEKSKLGAVEPGATGDQTAGEVPIDVIGTPGYTTVQKLIDILFSAGVVDGGDTSDNGDGTIDVALGLGLTRSTNDKLAPLLPFNWVDSNNIAIPDGVTRYVGVEYNGGSPQISVRTVHNWNNQTDFSLSIVNREGSIIHISPDKWTNGDHSTKANERLHDVERVRRADSLGGLIIGETGVRNFTLSGGVIYSLFDKSLIADVDTSISGGVDMYVGATLDASAVTQRDNLNYDSGGVKTLMNSGRYANIYMYAEFDGQLVGVYGTGQYTSVELANSELPPSILPSRISQHGIELGRYLFQQGAGSAIEIQSIFDKSYGTATPTDHATLGGLQGGIVGERYHLDLAEYTRIVGGLRKMSELDEIYKLAIGSIVETISVTVSENAGVVSLNLEKDGGGDINLIFSTGIELFDCTPIASVVLTLGTDVAEIQNYVYIPISTKILTVSTTGFPLVEHIPIARTSIPSASRVAADGTMGLHVWTDHTSLEGDNGHLNHSNSWIRAQFATHISGVEPSTSVTTNGGLLDNLDCAVTSGMVRQLHELPFPPFDTATGSTTYVINDPVTANKAITDLNAIDVDAAGTTLRNNNDRYVLIRWGTISQNAIDCKININLPTGKYGGNGGAIDDAAIFDTQQTANYTMPSKSRGIGFLISRLVVKYTTTNGGTLVVLSEDSLLGNSPSIINGGTPVTVNEYFTSLFRLLDSTDSSKVVAFDTSGLSPATTRTLTIQNKDHTLAGLDDLPTDGEIETSYNNQVSIVSQAEAEAGISTIVRRWTAQRVAQAIAVGLPPYSNTDMLSIVTPSAGQQVFNTTWKRVYTYDGDVWLTPQLVKATNQNIAAMVEGNPIIQDGVASDGVDMTSLASSIAIVGVVKDVYGGGGTGQFVSVAVSGIHRVLCSGNVSIGEGIISDNVDGQATSTGTGSSGMFGIVRESRSGGGTDLLLSWLQPTERF